MITKKIIYPAIIFTSLFLFISCSDNNENFASTQADSKEATFPIIIDENTSKKEVVVDGKTYIFNINKGMQKTRSITGSIYPRNPNATLASIPVMASKGTYKKYAKGSFSPFAELAGASIVMLRLDKFTFECKGPSNAKQTSFDITNITEEGFATESAAYKGFSIDQILSTTSGVIVKCSFYIQDGIAYNIVGQQLTPNTYYPLPGNKVQYQFTYELRN